MKELELELQKLKDAIDIKCPYSQIEAIGRLGLELKDFADELGHNFDRCVNNALEDLR